MSTAQNGATLLVRSLEANGVDTCYALPGEETIALMDALAASSIAVVLCRHEQGAAFMASVHARLTGKPVACLATLGPGATNLVTGLADATLDLAPVIAVTGQGARNRLGQGRNSHQVVDLEALFEPVTLYSRRLMMPGEISGAVAEALRIAQGDAPGAVHLSLPEDLADAEAPGEPVVLPLSHAGLAPADAIAAATDALDRAERPIVLAGAGVLRAGAVEPLRRFLDRTQLPLATSFMAKGILPSDAAAQIGTFGLPVEDHIDGAIAEADLIFAVGLDPVEYSPAKLTDHGRIPVIAVSARVPPADVGWQLAASLVGDVEHSLEELTRALNGRTWSLWPQAVEARDALREDRAKHRLGATQSPASDGALVAALEAALTPSDIVLSGVGTHKLSIARTLAPQSPRQVLIANGLAGMGLALPGAIAAAQLYPERRVIAVCGDGDVMMNVQEMETATRLGVGITVVVWLDGGYGLIEQKHQSQTGDDTDLSFASTEWDHLARAFHWRFTACENAGALEQALTQAKPGDTPHLITVPVRYDGSLT